MGYLVHFRDKARYWLKISIFIPPAFDAAAIGGLRRNTAITFDAQTLR